VFQSYVEPFRDEAGQIVGTIGTGLDITARKRAETALLESEELFRSYFELGLIGMAITSPTTGILEVNDEICRILGYERDELLRMTWAALTHPDDLAADDALFNRVLAGEIDGYAIDKRWIRKDGRIIDSHISVKCVRRADKSVDYFVALLQDITARKQAEQALRESEARFRAVADLVPDLLWSRDAQGAEWYNRRWTEYTGQRSEQAARLGWLDVIHPDDRAQSLARFEHALGTGQPLHHEHRIRGIDGTYRWFLLHARPLQDEQGHIVRWFAAATDIQDQRRARDVLEERIRQRTAALEAANAEQQAQMVARQAAEGELRQSNARLRGLSERLLAVQEEERRTIARELHDEVGQYLTGLRFMLESLGKVTGIPHDPQLANALAVVDDLTTRVRELSLGLRPSMLDDAGLVSALLWHVERYTRQTGIEVTLGHQGLDERLPAPIETAVYRIVQEALTNVARHAETTQVNVQILADGQVTVLIEDAGKGFDVGAVLAHHASTGVSGMRERAELLSGEFLIESQPGEGTRVLVEIPLDVVR
jgi:PAS domain S-box-containing protein